MGTCWERFTWQGFTPHFHDCTIGDDLPGLMDPVAIQQVATYKAGGDGVAGTTGDTQPYRPNPIHNYVFQEDDMDAAERAELFRIGNKLDRFVSGELKRDEAERLRDKERFSRMITILGAQADELGILIDKTSDAATKLQLQRTRDRILRELADDPDVTGVDNPDPSQIP
jgi:hypothetical protein